eukprot:g27424.t1
MIWVCEFIPVQWNVQDGDAACLMSGSTTSGAKLFNASSRFVTLLQQAGFGADTSAHQAAHLSLTSETIASLVGSLQALIELEAGIGLQLGLFC